jgi:hypothetical protein
MSRATKGFRLSDDGEGSADPTDSKYTKRKLQQLQLQHKRMRWCVCASMSTFIVMVVLVAMLAAMVAVFVYHYNEKNQGIQRKLRDAQKMVQTCESITWPDGIKEDHVLYKHCVEAEDAIHEARPAYESFMFALQKVGEYFVLHNYIACDHDCASSVHRTWDTITPFLGWYLLGLLVLSTLVVWGICIPIRRQREVESKMKLLQVQHDTRVSVAAYDNSFHDDMDQVLNAFKCQLPSSISLSSSSSETNP